MGFRFIDLFAGIGAFRRAFESIGGTCIYTSERDRFCQLTYLRNFPGDHPIAGDINDVEPASIPEFDVLLAGFPCQPFSIAGVSKKRSLGRAHGFDDREQGNLFFKIHEILEHHRPPAFLLENVRNLLSHDRGTTFEIIYRLLGDGTLPDELARHGRTAVEQEKIDALVRRHGSLGYQLSHRVFDAKGFVPQHRERVFIAGVRGEGELEVDLDLVEMPEPFSGPRLRSILHEHQPNEVRDGTFVMEDGNVNPKYTLSDELWGYLQEYAEGHRRRGNGFGYGLVSPDDVARTLSARYYKDGSEILVSRGKSKTPRRLTPRECSRLMGFDELNGSEWKIPVSDTQAYKQFGNAAVVPVVTRIAEYMERLIKVTSGDGWQRPLPLRRAGATA